MDKQEQKRRQLERHLRSVDKHVGYEERKRRKAAARERKGSHRGRGARRKDWKQGRDSDDEVVFEKIERARPAPAPRRARTLDESLPRATVVAVHRGRVELEGGRKARLAAHLAADPSFRIAVGDEAAFGETEGVACIHGVAPRRTWLARSDPGSPSQELVIAANVDVCVIVAAAVEPPLRPGLIDRFLLALDRGGVEAVVCVNKNDLLTPDQRAEVTTLVAPYAELDVPVTWCSAVAGTGIAELAALLAGRTCVFVGHSGVGKSSLLNAIDPAGGRDTGEVRAFDGRGRHTTTSSSLRELANATRVIDTPGVRSFGLGSLTLADVRAGFPDLAAFAPGCRFRDCTHVHEQECAVRDAVDAGRLSAARFGSYRRLVDEAARR